MDTFKDPDQGGPSLEQQEEARIAQIRKRQADRLAYEASVKNEAQLAQKREQNRRAETGEIIAPDPNAPLTADHWAEGRAAVERHTRNVQGVSDPRDIPPVVTQPYVPARAPTGEVLPEEANPTMPAGLVSPTYVPDRDAPAAGSAETAKTKLEKEVGADTEAKRKAELDAAKHKGVQHKSAYAKAHTKHK